MWNEGIIDSYEKWDAKVIDDIERRPNELIDTMSNRWWSDDATKKYRVSVSLEKNTRMWILVDLKIDLKSRGFRDVI